MFAKNLDKLRIAPYMKEYLTRTTTTSVNKAVEYYNSKHYLAEKYVATDFECPKKQPYLGIFLFVASSITFYLLSDKKHDN